LQQLEKYRISSLSRQALSAANINPDSYLATDYLNHFNEIVMLLDLLTTMPEVADDIMEWEPKSYEQHFLDTQFTEKELAIAAYQQAPQEIRKAFDSLVERMEKTVLNMQAIVASLPADGHLDPALCEEITMIVATQLRPMIDQASGIIHNHDSEVIINDEVSGITAQDAIDALFE
jgi:hypothetical protein